MNWYDKEKNRRRKSAAFYRKGDPYQVGKKEQQNRSSSFDKEALDMVRIRKRTSLGEIFSSYISLLADLLKDNVPELEEMSFELRGEEDLGFRFTKYDESGEKITFYVDCSFNLAPEYIKVNMNGARGGQNFSEKVRLFMTDPAMKTARRMASLLRRK